MDTGILKTKRPGFVDDSLRSGEEKVLRTGITSFINSGEFSKDFIDDVNMMISKVYSQWSLYEDEDEFNGFCWTKIVSLLDVYDSKFGSLSNFLYSIISNEATRIHSKHKKMSTDDALERLHLGFVQSMWGSTSGSGFDHYHGHDFLHRDRVCSFARRAFELGIYVDQQELYKNYLLGNLSPAVRAFMWHSILQSKKKEEAYYAGG